MIKKTIMSNFFNTQMNLYNLYCVICKKKIFENLIFLVQCHYGMSKYLSNGFFQISDLNIPKINKGPKISFF